MMQKVKEVLQKLKGIPLRRSHLNMALYEEFLIRKSLVGG